MQGFETILNDLLGLNAEDLNVGQMALRAVVVYITTLIMVRWGETRFLGKSAAFDVILGIILGSVVSRGINGGASLGPTLVAGFVLVGLHWLFALLAFRLDFFGPMVKGSTRTLVKDGEIQWRAMRKSNISEKDLRAAIRSQANTDALEEVAMARLERSGEISVIKRGLPPRVVEVDVRNGVQTVRIQLD